MAKLLLDSNGNVNIPTIIMSNKALEKLGTIPYDYTSLEYNKNIGYSEASFVVYKTWTDELGNEVECRFWDDLTDLSVVYIRDYDEYFEVEVSLDESDSISKTITLTSLHVAELSQINVYLEVNTEEDIDRDDYLFPTVFYNPSDASVSLLNRIIDEKASHYSIGTVPNTLRNIQRTFSWSGSSIWEAFEDIEEEIGCKFLVEGRTINVVDMMTTCSDCGYRGDYLTECPKCGGSNVTLPYGKFTNIYVSRENLSEDITLTTEDADSKNCFRLEAGDEDMTAAVINLNPSGSRYIYYFSDKLKNRISNGLKTALEQYEEDYETYKNNSYSFPLAHASDFDTLADKYNSNDYTVYKYNENNERVLTSNSFLKTDSVTSYAKLVEFYYDAYNFYYYLNDTLMPSVEVDIETAQGQLNRIIDTITDVGISGYDPAKTSNETVSNAIKMLCSAMIVGAFKVSVFCTRNFVEEGVYAYDTTITVTNYRDDEDVASDTTEIIVSNDVEMTFVQQMQNNLKTYFEDRDSLNDSSIYRMIDYNDDDLTGFQEYLTYYNLADLDSFENAYNEVISVLEEQASSDLDDIETAYRNKLTLISAEKVRRESEVEKIETLLEDVESAINSVKSALDMNTNYLTTKALQDEFNSYRREDTYENSNYSSEGLSDSELMERAAEFYETALTEVENATKTVYNINANIHNLLMMPEFESLWEDFEVCNWIAFRVDDKIFRLRILSYRIQFDEDSLATIDVDFTTATEGKTASLFGSTQQILQSAKSMATSYPYVKYQTNINKISVEEINALTALLNSQLANKNSDISNLTSNNIAMSGSITSLQADNVTINGRLTANEASIDTLEANDVTINGRLTANEANINTLNANKADITDLTASNARITNLETEYVTVSGTLEAHTGRIHNLEADTAKIHDLTANQISATVGYIGDLTSENITAQDLVAMNGTIENLDTNYAHITNGVIDNATISHADVDDLDVNYAHITNGVIDNANIDVADVNNLSANYAHISNGVIDNANIDYADVNNLNTHYAEIDLANVNNAWIQDGVIKNAAISDAQIIGVSANKLTAGTIDASNITVTNLNASNITTGTINGQRIGTGSLSLDKLADDVYTESEVDALINGIQTQVDGAIETWTGSVVPTLNNVPASSWTDNDTKANHVGDIYYVVNAGNQADGYCYRFAYDSTTSTYGWVLIKDSDVTAALQRLLEAEGDIDDLETFQSTTSSWISNTDEELTSIKSNHTTLETTVNTTIKSTTQLWFTKADTTAPNKPTAHVTSTSTNGNVWTKVVPEYNSSYPNYFYCYEWEYANGTYGWSDVVRDIGMGEVQSTARTASFNASTALTNATTAQTTANSNIKSVVQLWFTKANATAPSQPTAHVTTNSHSSYNTWNTVVPTYNEIYPYYYYCYEYQKGDGTYSWSDVVYDSATSENQKNSRDALSQVSTKVETSVFNTLSQTVEENSNSITSLSTTVASKADSSTVTTLSNTVNTVSQTTNSNSSTLSNLTTRLGTNADGTASSTDIVAKESALEQDLNGFKTTVSSTYQTIDNMSNYSTTEQMNSAISQSASNITTTVSQTYATQTSLNNEINQRKAIYGTSSTDAGTATKAVTCENFSLYTGATIRVKFSKANTNATPSLNVNNTDAKAIKNFAGGNLVEGEYGWKANATLDFVYDGTNWLLVDNGMTARVSSAESSISQNADNIELKVSKDGVISSINQSPESVTINANRVNIAGAAIFTSGRLSENSLDNAYDAKGAAATAQSNAESHADSAISTYDTNTVQATYATKVNAIAQEQRVYYKSASSSKPASPTSTWVTKINAGANTWTTYRMPYDQSYPYLYTCIQKQTVSGTITCTTVLLDDTTTVIDGGKIITGSVTANQLSADAIKSNNYVASSTSGSPYSSGGTFLDLSNGNIYTPNFGVQAASGTAYLNGEIIATSGTIGDDNGNYWSIGNTTDYEGDTSASIVANGTAYIQNGDWQISNGESNYSNGSINTQRYITVSGGGLQLTYPFYDNTYYDFGVTSPVLDTASSRYYNSTVSDNFLYIRKHASTIPSLASDWNYVFRVDKEGNAYVNNLYVNGTSIATMISDGVDGGAYLSTSGGTVNGDVTITGSLTATASKATADASGNTITTTYMKLAGTQTNSGTNTFSGSNTFSGTTTISKANGLVYSGIQASSTNAATYVWFSKSGTNGTPVYDNDFKYNPSTNVLTVGSITGTAAKATADASGNTITTTYATKADTVMTGDATAEDLTVSGTLTATLTGNVTGNVSGSAGSLTTNAGSATQPIYFSGGVPVATTYALNKTVPSDAVFTDTNWYHSTGTWSGLKYTAGKSNTSMSALEFTIPTGTTATTVALGNHTHNYASKVTLAGTDYSSSSNAITITKANLQSAIQDTDLVLMTAAERSKLSSIQVSSGGTIDFSGVTASTPLTATVNSTNGTVNITHDDSGATTGTYRSVTVDAKGHVTAGTNPTTLSGYGITDAKITGGVITLGSNTITPLVASSTLDATKLSGTASISTTGNASTASALATSGTIRTNLASTSAVTYTSGGNITPGVTGTLGVGNGGTGQTSAKNAANAFMNALDTGSTTPIDADYYISQYVGGGTATTTYHRRPMSALWAYIKSKMGNDTSTLDGMYVKLSTAQTVGGAKTFSDTATFNSLIQANGNITIKGTTSNSTVYDASNPKITFLNGGGNQGIQLIYTDWDSVVSPASLTLVGEQTSTNGGERFIAPNVRVNNRFEYGTNAYTTYNSATKSIDFIFN